MRHSRNYPWLELFFASIYLVYSELYGPLAMIWFAFLSLIVIRKFFNYILPFICSLAEYIWLKISGKSQINPQLDPNSYSLKIDGNEKIIVNASLEQVIEAILSLSDKTPKYIVLNQNSNEDNFIQTYANINKSGVIYFDVNFRDSSENHLWEISEKINLNQVLEIFRNYYSKKDFKNHYNWQELNVL